MKQDDEILLAKVAILRADGELQKDIKTKLEISQATVSRLSQKAFDDGWLETRITSRIPDQILDRAKRELFSDSELSAIVQRWNPLTQVHVLGHAPYYDSAAHRLAEILPKSRTVGISWGRTLHQILSRLDEFKISTPLTQLRCLPLCGEPSYLMNQQELGYSASLLAKHLAEIVGSTGKNHSSLTGVPAYLASRHFELNKAGRRRSTEMESFISAIPGYRDIFGSANPLINEVDTLLLGVGTATGERMGTFISERIVQEGIQESDLGDHILGDIGGLLIGREEGGDVEEKYNEGWMGLTLAKLQEIAKRSVTNEAQGIIVFAKGERKANIVRTVVERGYVNQLVIDTEISDTLKAMAAGESA